MACSFGKLWSTPSSANTVSSWYASYRKRCIFTDFNIYQIDEAHERSIYTDLLLGILKKSVTILAFGKNNPVDVHPEYEESARPSV